MRGQVIENLGELGLATGCALRLHIVDHPLPALATQAQGSRAIRFVTVAADFDYRVATLALRQLRLSTRVTCECHNQCESERAISQSEIQTHIKYCRKLLRISGCHSIR